MTDITKALDKIEADIKWHEYLETSDTPQMLQLVAIARAADALWQHPALLGPKWAEDWHKLRAALDALAGGE